MASALSSATAANAVHSPAPPHETSGTKADDPTVEAPQLTLSEALTQSVMGAEAWRQLRASGAEGHEEEVQVLLGTRYMEVSWILMYSNVS